MSPARTHDRRVSGSMSRAVDGLVADALRAGFTARTDIRPYRLAREVVLLRPGPEFVDGVLVVGAGSGRLLRASFCGTGQPRTSLTTVAAARYFLKTLAAGGGYTEARAVARSQTPRAAFTAVTGNAPRRARAACPRATPAATTRVAAMLRVGRLR